MPGSSWIFGPSRGWGITDELLRGLRKIGAWVMNYMNWRVYTLKKMLVHLRKATSWKELWKVGTEQTQVSKFRPLEQQLSELALQICSAGAPHVVSRSHTVLRCRGAPTDFIAGSWFLAISIPGSYAWVLRTRETDVVQCSWFVWVCNQSENITYHHTTKSLYVM